MRLLSCMLTVGWMLAEASRAISPLAADGPPDARCTCRNRDGARHELGTVICLNVDGRKYLARCEMVLNVTSWQKVQDGCPVASTPVPNLQARL